MFSIFNEEPWFFSELFLAITCIFIIGQHKHLKLIRLNYHEYEIEKILSIEIVKKQINLL